jgi:hypothetical protein
MSASYDGTILDHLAEHMLYLSMASLFWFSLSLSHDHGFHLSQQLGITPHDYAALLQRGGSGSGSAAAAAAEAAAGGTAHRQQWQRGSSAVAEGSAMVVSTARQQRWQRRGRALVKAWRRQRERSGSGGGGVSTLAASSLVAAVAAWR